MPWGRRLGTFVVIIAWLAGLIALFAIDHSGKTYAIAGGLLTILVGALLNSWWIVAAPVVVAAAIVLAAAIAGQDCSDCSEEGFTVAVVSWITLLLFALPATVALAAGIATRRLMAARGERSR
jgi:hypothetical protein